MNREVEAGFPQLLAGKLDKAVQLATGRLGADEDGKWQTYLAQNDDSAKAAPAQAAAGAAPSPNNARNYAAGTPLGAPSRSRRSGAKRRYDDESFEGYSESFADDAAGIKAGDEDDDTSSGMKKKQRRRVRIQSPASQSPSKPTSRKVLHEAFVGFRKEV